MLISNEVVYSSGEDKEWDSYFYESLDIDCLGQFLDSCCLFKIVLLYLFCIFVSLFFRNKDMLCLIIGVGML